LAGYEMAVAAGILPAQPPFFRRILAGLRMPPAAGAPLLAGLFLGIAYGAGIIIPSARERNLSKREILSLSLFLCTCHAVVEDTLLFVLVGAKGGWLVVIRLSLAVLVTRTAARFAAREPQPEGTEQPGGPPG